MTNRERVRASLAHRQPDKTPYHIGFTLPAQAATATYLQDPFFVSKLGNALATMGTTGKDAWKEGDCCTWEDEWGVQWNRSIDKDIGIVCNQVVTPATLETLFVPDPDDPTRFDYYDTVIKPEGARTDQFVVADLGFSLYERAWTLAGMETVLMGMVSDKAFANALLDRILEYNLRIIDHACVYDIDAMMFGDDWGSQTGLQMGLKLWREFIRPRVAQMYAAVKAHGKFVFIHSCGKCTQLFPDLIEIGLDCFNPFQPEVIDVAEAKREFGKDLTFFGGISTQRGLPYGTPDEVKAEVRRLIEVVGKDGGLIASPAHAIPADAKPANIAAMIEVLQGQ